MVGTAWSRPPPAVPHSSPPSLSGPPRMQLHHTASIDTHLINRPTALLSSWAPSASQRFCLGHLFSKEHTQAAHGARLLKARLAGSHRYLVLPLHSGSLGHKRAPVLSSWRRQKCQTVHGEQQIQESSLQRRRQVAAESDLHISRFSNSLPRFPLCNRPLDFPGSPSCEYPSTAVSQ